VHGYVAVGYIKALISIGWKRCTGVSMEEQNQGATNRSIKQPQCNMQNPKAIRTWEVCCRFGLTNSIFTA
jgi:hypothetical protein